MCLFASGYITAELANIRTMSNAASPNASRISMQSQSEMQPKSLLRSTEVLVEKTANLSATGGVKSIVALPTPQSSLSIISSMNKTSGENLDSTKHNRPKKINTAGDEKEPNPKEKISKAPENDRDTYFLVGPPIVSFGDVTSASEWFQRQGQPLSSTTRRAQGIPASSHSAPKRSSKTVGSLAGGAEGIKQVLQPKDIPRGAVAAAYLLSPELPAPAEPLSTAIYSLRLETHKTRLRAEEAVRRFKSESIPAKIYVEIDEREKKWFTVAAGAFDTADAAQVDRARIREKYDRLGSIVLIRPIVNKKKGKKHSPSKLPQP